MIRGPPEASTDVAATLIDDVERARGRADEGERKRQLPHGAREAREHDGGAEEDEGGRTRAGAASGRQRGR